MYYGVRIDTRQYRSIMSGRAVVLLLRPQPCRGRGRSGWLLWVVHLAIVSYRRHPVALIPFNSFLPLASLVEAGKSRVTHALGRVGGEVEVGLSSGGQSREVVNLANQTGVSVSRPHGTCAKLKHNWKRRRFQLLLSLLGYIIS